MQFYFQTISKIETHIKSLEKLEYDMLQKVFNMFVDIPKNVAINIPGIRNPSSLPHLKRVRQKIKNKLKVAKTQLLEYQQKTSNKYNTPSIKSDMLMSTVKMVKYDSQTTQKSNSNNSNFLLTEKLCDKNKNNMKLSNLKQDCNKFNINKTNTISNTNTNCNDIFYNILDNGCISETQNEINKSKKCINLQTKKLYSSMTHDRLEKLTSTVTSSSTNSKENNEICCHQKSNISLNIVNQRSSSTQIMNMCKSLNITVEGKCLEYLYNSKMYYILLLIFQYSNKL